MAKTLSLLDKATTQEEQAHYVFHLRNLKTGWALDQRKHYFDWLRFAQAAAQGRDASLRGAPEYPWASQTNMRAPSGRTGSVVQGSRPDYSDGASYSKYLANFRQDAVAALSESEQLALSSWTADYAAMADFKPTKQRNFTKKWNLAELEPKLGGVAEGRNFANGKAAFHDAHACGATVSGAKAGSVGPELGAVARKYSTREILAIDRGTLQGHPRAISKRGHPEEGWRDRDRPNHRRDR